MKAKYKVGEIITVKPGIYIPKDAENRLCPGRLNDFTDAIIEDIYEHSLIVEYIVRMIDGEFTDRLALAFETDVIDRRSYWDEDIDVVDMSELL